MAKPDETGIGLNLLTEEDRAYYDKLFKQDVDAAEYFLDEAIKGYELDLEIEPEKVPTLYGIDDESETPAEVAAQDEAKAAENLNERIMLMNPLFLDEEQRAGYDQAVEYYVNQGFPNEDLLGTQFQIEFENATGPIIFEGTEYSWGGQPRPDDGDFGRDSIEYDMQVLDYGSKRLENVLSKMGPDVKTAQQQAKEELYGPTGPRAPRAPKKFGGGKTPTPVGMLQQNPELAKELSLTETFVQALLPQVIMTGEQARADKAQRQMWVEQSVPVIFDYNEEEEDRDFYGGQVRFFLEDWEEMTKIDVSQMLYRQEVDFDRMLTLDPDERQELEDIYNEKTLVAETIARKAMREKIKDLYKYSEEFREEMEMGDTTLKELLNEYPAPDEGTYQNVMNTVGEVFSQLTTAESPEDRERMYRMGIAPDPDAVTETMSMAALRDLNLPLRLAINPLMDQAENLGLIERFDPLEEKETVLPAARIELTEDSDLFDLPSNYLKEALVDTATMRGLGNDLAQIKSIGLIPGGTYIGASFDVPDEVRNGLVYAGTLAEFFVPIIPKVKGIGSVAQGGVKTLSGGRLTGGTTRVVTNLLASGDPLTGLAYLGVEGAQKYGGNAVRNIAFGRVAGVNTASKFIEMTPSERLSTFNNSSKFSSNIAEGVSDSLFELDIRRNYKPDVADVLVQELVDTNVITRSRYRDLDQKGAIQKYDKALSSDSKLIKQTAEYYNGRNPAWKRVIDDERDVIKNSSFNPEGYQGFEKRLIEQAQNRIIGGRQPTMELMRGTWLDDSIRATDRLIVSEEFMKRKGNKALLEEFDGENRFIARRYNERTGESVANVTDDGSVLVNKEYFFDDWAYGREIPFRLNSNDAFLNDIIKKVGNGERLTANEFMYFNNRIVEEILFEASEGKAVKVTRDPEILERASLDPGQRSPIIETWRGYGRIEADKGLTYLKNFSDKWIKRLGDEQIKINKSNRKVLKEMGADTPDSRNFINQVESAIVRTGKTSQQTIAHVAAEIDTVPLQTLYEGFEGMTKSEKTYTTMLTLQAIDTDFARIGTMTGSEMSLNINRASEVIPDHPIPGTTHADLAMRELLGFRAGAMRSSDGVQAFLQRQVGNQYVDVNKYFKLADELVDEFPELSQMEFVFSNKKYEPLNAVLMQKEIRLQYYKAVEDNFLHRQLGDGIESPAMNIHIEDAKTGKSRPLVESVEKQNQLVDEFVKIRLTETDEVARTSGYATILEREGIIKAPKEPVRGADIPELVPEDWTKVSPKQPADLKLPQYKRPKQRTNEKPDTYKRRVERYDAEYNRRYKATEEKNIERRDVWIEQYNKELKEYGVRHQQAMDAREAAVRQVEVDFEVAIDNYRVQTDNLYVDTRTYVELISNGAVEHVTNYARGLGLQLDRLPQQVVSDVRYRLDNVLDGKSNILLSPKEVDILSDVRARLGDINDTAIFQGNLINANAKQYGNYARDAMDYATYGLEGFRRNWTQGQLGGKALPNPTYILENQMTATLITYVTNPKYLKDVGVQTGKTMAGRTPYKQLRNLAMEAPAEMYPGTRYTNKQMFDLYNQYNLGTSSAGINLGPNFRNDMIQLAGSSRFIKRSHEKLRKIIGYDPLDIFPNVKEKRLGSTLSGVLLPNTTSPWMRFADDADRAFREAIFIRAVQDGLSPQSAAIQAQKVLLDYGRMPQWMRQGFGRMALYFSFTYMTGVEMFKAMATPKGIQRVSALANFNRQQMRLAGTWFGADNRSVEPLFYNVIQNEEGEDTSRAYAYIRAPYVGNIASLGELGGSLYGQLSGRSEPMTIEDAIVGTQKYLYIPAFDVIKGMLYQGRRTVPQNLLREISEGTGTYTNVNRFMDLVIGNGGANPWTIESRYRLAVRTPDDERPGRPSVGGRQYYFRDSKGYNNYISDQFLMNSLGLNRTISEYTNGFIQGGLIDVPEDYYMDFDDKGIPRMFMYYGLRERPIRLPQEDEMRYRAFRQSLKGLKRTRQEYK